MALAALGVLVSSALGQTQRFWDGTATLTTPWDDVADFADAFNWSPGNATNAPGVVPTGTDVAVFPGVVAAYPYTSGRIIDTQFAQVFGSIYAVQPGPSLRLGTTSVNQIIQLNSGLVTTQQGGVDYEDPNNPFPIPRERGLFFGWSLSFNGGAANPPTINDLGSPQNLPTRFEGGLSPTGGLLDSRPLRKTGPGYISINSNNGFNGLQIDQGIVRVDRVSALGRTSFGVTGPVKLADNTTLWFDAPLTLNRTFTVTGAATLQAQSGTTTLTSGARINGANASSRPILWGSFLANGTATFDAPGGVEVRAGWLTLGASTVNFPSSTPLFLNGGTLELSPSTSFGLSTIDMASGAIQIQPSATLNLESNATRPQIRIAGGRAASLITGGIVFLPFGATEIAGARSFDGATDLAISSILSGGSTSSVGIADVRVQFNTPMPYTGSTIIRTNGLLRQGVASAIPANTSLTLAGTVDANGFDLSARSLTGDGQIVNAQTVTVGGADSTFGGLITGTSAGARLVKTGTSTLTMSASTAPPFGFGIRVPVSVQGGTLDASSTGALDGVPLDIASGATTIVRQTQRVSTLSGSGTLTIADSAATLRVGDGTFTGTITSNVGTLNKVGPGQLTLGGNLQQAGIVSVDGGLIIATTAGRVAQLNLNTTFAYSAPSSANAFYVGDLRFPNAGSGQLLLTASAVVLDYSSGPFPQFVENLIRSGYNNGAWNGWGIVSNTAGTNTGRWGVGYAQMSQIFTTPTGTWKGVQVDATSMLVRFTLLGDANLDGTVNFDDLLKLAASYSQSGKSWANGDFTYDGVVNFDDLLKLASNYNQTLSGSFAGDWALAQASVPEPTTLVGLTSLSIAMTRRRRTRRKRCR
jgi:hypothetical protein